MKQEFRKYIAFIFNEILFLSINHCLKIKITQTISYLSMDTIQSVKIVTHFFFIVVNCVSLFFTLSSSYVPNNTNNWFPHEILEIPFHFQHEN